MANRNTSSVSTFAEALYDVVHRSDVPAKAIAEELGISYQLLANCANMDMDKPRFHADRVVALTRAANNFALLDYMEQATGRVAIKIRNSGSADDVLRASVDAAAQFGRLAGDVAHAAADGRITEVELHRIEEAGYAAAQAIMNAVDAARKACR